jgi:hypothetical protein
MVDNRTTPIDTRSPPLHRAQAVEPRKARTAARKLSQRALNTPSQDSEKQTDT